MNTDSRDLIPRSPAKQFLWSFGLGCLAILIALLLMMFTCMALGAGITPGTFYLPPLLWAIYFLLLSPVVLLAMRSKNISKPGFITAIALFILLNGYCWANLGKY